MKDPVFVHNMALRAKEAGTRAGVFTSLSPEQLNWKTNPESWSVAQCLDHLVVSDSLYFTAFKKIGNGEHQMNFWEKWSPLSGLFGNMLVNQVQEKVQKKLKAPKPFIPSESQIDPGINDRFQKHLDTLTDYIRSFRHVDLDKTHITSPVSKAVTYSLRNAIKILVQHEHRHINQALRVMEHQDFPSLVAVE